jgi:ABC-type uncharacterized transport system permease subunit
LYPQAIIMGVLPTLIHENLMWVFIVLIWILAMFYGAGFGLMPAFLTAMFGSQNIGYEKAFALNLGGYNTAKT